jgi:hypothetical protein
LSPFTTVNALDTSVLDTGRRDAVTTISSRLVFELSARAGEAIADTSAHVSKKFCNLFVLS